ncbi:hypothetical protein BH11ARM2_BH11ARM2_29170 [soil metagenome]
MIPLILALQTPPSAKVWEKPLAPGLIYRTEVDPAGPFVSYALRVSPEAPDVRVEPVLAGTSVFGPGPLFGRGTVTQMAEESGAIAAINTDFFPLGGGRGTGDPLGGLIIDGELVSVGGMKRAVFGWGSAGAGAGFLDWNGSFGVAGGPKIPLQGLNEETGLNRVVLDTERAGIAFAKTPSVMATLQLDQEGPLHANEPRSAKVVALENNVTERPISPGQVVLCAQGTRMAALNGLKLGDTVRFGFETRGLDATRQENVIGGGPFLLRNGTLAIDGGDEKFDDKSFVQKRHPRSAVGRTAAGDLIFFAVDGRTKVSVGMSLPELAAKMARLGCVEAINLDGGGSTALSLFGAAANRPSDGKERAVAAGVAFFAEAPKDPRQPSLVFRRRVSDDYVATLQLAGKPVPNGEIVWSAMGDAWIDGGGLVTPIQSGAVTVRAVWRGKVVTNAYPVRTKRIGDKAPVYDPAD